MGEPEPVTFGKWREKTYSEEAGDMSYALMLDVYCGGSKTTLREGRLLDWRMRRAVRRVRRMEARRLAQKARREALLSRIHGEDTTG